MTAPTKKRLGELLVEAGVIDETQLSAALGHQRQWGIRLGSAVVDLKLASESDIVRVLAKRFGFEVARLDQVEAYAHAQAVTLVPRDFAAKNNVFPLGADTSVLAVAMADPTNLAVVDELRFRTGRRVKVFIGGDREIAAAVAAAYPSEDGGVEAIALDIDDGSPPGEPGATVMDGFGGGSPHAFDAFFGTDRPTPASAPPTAAPAVPAADLGGAPNPFLPAAPASPAPAGGPPASGSGPAPRSTPAALAAPAAARPLPAPAPAPPAPGPPPVAPRGAPPAGAVARAPTVPAMRAMPSAPAPLLQRPPGGAPRPAAGPAPSNPAPAAPAGRPGAAPAPASVPGSLPRPGPRSGNGAQAVPAPPAAVAAPVRRPTAERPDLALEFPSADALSEARARRGEAAAVAPPGGAAPVEELLPLAEEPRRAPAANGYGAADQAVLEALERLAAGGHAELELLKPTQAIAVLIRLLVKKGIVDERELLEGLRKGRE